MPYACARKVSPTNCAGKKEQPRGTVWVAKKKDRERAGGWGQDRVHVCQPTRHVGHATASRTCPEPASIQYSNMHWRNVRLRAREGNSAPGRRWLPV